jgi:lipoprotein
MKRIILLFLSLGLLTSCNNTQTENKTNIEDNNSVVSINYLSSDFVDKQKFIDDESIIFSKEELESDQKIYEVNYEITDKRSIESKLKHILIDKEGNEVYSRSYSKPVDYSDNTNTNSAYFLVDKEFSPEKFKINYKSGKIKKDFEFDLNK